MRLYRKKLHSVEELRREVHVLKYAKKQSDSESWLDMKDIGLKGFGSSSKTKTNSAFDAGILGTLISAMGSRSWLNIALAIAPPVFSLISKRSKKKNFLESAAKDVLGGYLKWKGINLAYRWIRRAVSKQKPTPHKH
jgi:hypothetical protein